MSTTDNTILIDEVPVPYKPGQTILEAALEGGVYIPHLCAHPEFAPHGSCKLCNVIVNGRNAAACTMKASPGQEIEVDTPDLQGYRRTLVQMLFVEGNHFCPGCEKSGAALVGSGYQPSGDPQMAVHGHPVSLGERRLATIFAADVIGYSRLMGGDKV